MEESAAILLLKMLDPLLGIIEEKYRSRYRDEYINLQQEWDDEYNKDEDKQDFDLLDGIEQRIRLLCDTVADHIGKQNAKVPS